MKRREFIKSSCLFCLGAAWVGTAASSLQSCTTHQKLQTTVVNRKIQFSSKLFATENTLIIQAPQLPFYLLCIQLENNQYKTLEMKCTHQNQPLTLSGSKLYCASHGSQFNLNGQVTAPPATQDLVIYPTHYENDTITINLVQ